MQTQDNVWPLPKFYFLVTIDGKEFPFQEVSGLDVETQPIEYRSGSSKQFSPVKMPGIKKFGNVTLKKGKTVNDDFFKRWSSAIKMNTAKRVPVTIELMDEAEKPIMTWTLKNVWPTKITSTDLKAEGNEVAIETLELAHEGLVISNT